MPIGILGGTGALGSGLAARLALAGLHVWLGSRSGERARARAQELNVDLPEPRIEGVANDEAVRRSDLVILAVPFEQAATLLSDLASHFQPAAIVVDVTVPVTFEGGRPRLIEVPEGSASAQLVQALPAGVRLVGALKTIPAAVLRRVEAALECDDLVYGDDDDARQQVIAVLRQINGLRPLDAGGLSAGAIVERMTLLAIELNRRHRVKTARYKVVGV